MDKDTNPMTSTSVTLLPCPFCGVELVRSRLGTNARHPDIECFLGSNVVPVERFDEWNTRSNQPPSPKAFCNKCGFLGVPDDATGNHKRPKDGELCPYFAAAPVPPLGELARELQELADDDGPRKLWPRQRRIVLDALHALQGTSVEEVGGA